MQIFGLHRNINKLAYYACTQEYLEDEVKERKKILGDWEILKKEGVSDRKIARITGISRSTYYRRKKMVELYGIDGYKRRSTRPKNIRKSAIPQSTIDIVLQIRKENLTYGKFKIAVILKRDHGINISESSVGRILRKLMDGNKITRSISARKNKRKRKFTSHAKRWGYDMKGTAPGEMVQIDHMSVSKHNLSMKHFQAWDPISKVIVADVTSNATSSAAAKFLRKLIASVPFKIKSIQVDGGSEFMQHFEEECEELGIELYVLPPASPKYNGGVERGNRTFREEFYATEIHAESIGEFRYELQKAVHKYNTYRPHFSLQGNTPLDYANKVLAA